MSIYRMTYGSDTVTRRDGRGGLVSAAPDASANLDRAAAKLCATKLASGDWAHYDDGTHAWHVVSESECAEYCAYLDSEDETIRRDAYSHWCAGTVSREATAEEVYEVTGEWHCECGEAMGERCAWAGPRAKTVLVEWMPEHRRASHEAAGNSGTWPANGAMRLRCERSCAEWLLGDDEESPWTVEVAS